MTLEAILPVVSVWLIPAVLAITLHEAAHGYAALRLGDDTAQRLGRVSLNPFRHVDLIGTIILPGLLVLSGSRFVFGYAKPVPVNFHRLNRPRRDMVLVAAAGPAMNILLGMMAGTLLRFVGILPDWIQDWTAANLENSIVINCILAIFNLIPLPPLDGGRIAVGLLPKMLARPLARLERWGMVILIGLVFALPEIGRWLRVDLDVIRWMMRGPAEMLLQFMFGLGGIDVHDGV